MTKDLRDDLNKKKQEDTSHKQPGSKEKDTGIPLQKKPGQKDEKGKMPR